MKQLLALMLSALILLSACTNYGKKANSGNIDVYYKEGATKEEAQKTADLFLMALQSANPDDKSTKSFQLTKPGDTVLLKMVVGDKKRMEAMGDVPFYAMAGLVSDSVFSGKPVNISLTDNKFKPFKTLTYDVSKVRGWGSKYTSGNVEVYSLDGFSGEHTQMLADFLNKEMKPASRFSFQVGMPEGQPYQVYMASSPEKAKAINDEMLKDLCSKMSENVFYGAGLVFHFTDDKFEPFRTYNFNTVAIDTNAVN